MLGRANAMRLCFGVRSRAAVFALFLCAALACGRESVLDKASREYDAGDYREAIFILRHHFKKGGERTPAMLFLAGKAWLKAGSEAEAQASFDECRKSDASFASKIALFYRDEAIASLESGDPARGRRMMLAAAGFQSGLDFGPYDFAAGKLYLERRDFDTAIRYLNRYLEKYPNAPHAAEALIDLAAAYEGMGDTGRAISIYRRFQESYPKSGLASNALWELESLLLKEAETLSREGETSAAESILVGLAPTAGSPLVKERVNFLLGELCERRGDAANAARYYREVVNSGSSGRLVEKAKERIERLEMPKRRRS